MAVRALATKLERTPSLLLYFTLLYSTLHAHTHPHGILGAAEGFRWWQTGLMHEPAAPSWGSGSPSPPGGHKAESGVRRPAHDMSTAVQCHGSATVVCCPWWCWDPRPILCRLVRTTAVAARWTTITLLPHPEIYPRITASAPLVPSPVSSAAYLVYLSTSLQPCSHP